MKQGGNKCSGALHTWPGALLWEHESTWPQGLVISVAEHQGELEQLWGLRLLSLVQDRHVPQVLLRPNTKVAV